MGVALTTAASRPQYARVKFSPTGDAWTGIRDSTSIELDHVQRPASCPLPDHCKAAAGVALDLERKAARVGPFPIEVPAKYADEYDA